jgi:nucleotide-binding universal stress UspA family protein
MAGMIVVGVDGSDAAQAALHWAAGEARLRRAALVAVHAWSNPVSPYERDDGAQEDAQKVLDDAIDGFAPEGVELRRVLAKGRPAVVLVDEAKGADLLVVGTRGHGPVGAAMGSVSTRCLRHAVCPVVVVPDHHAVMAAEG